MCVFRLDCWRCNGAQDSAIMWCTPAGRLLEKSIRSLAVVGQFSTFEVTIFCSLSPLGRGKEDCAIFQSASLAATGRLLSVGILSCDRRFADGHRPLRSHLFGKCLEGPMPPIAIQILKKQPFPQGWRFRGNVFEMILVQKMHHVTHSGSYRVSDVS